MNTETVTIAPEIETIKISNGFQRGEWVKFLEIRNGKWEVMRTVSTGECTWTTDEKVSGLEVRLEGKGIFGGHYGVSAFTDVNTTPGFFGFTKEELDGPTPEKGYTVECLGVRTETWSEVVTLRDYLTARFSNKSFHPWSERGDGLWEMPYQWGDQAAASFALVLDGKLVNAVTGCGDRTPYLTESVEKCMADRKIHHTDKFTDWAVERGEAKNRVLDAISRGGSEKWAKVLAHLKCCYKNSRNPLRSLRRAHPGTWTYFGPGVWQGDVKDNAIIFLEIQQLEESSKGWTVVYTPSK